MTHHPFRPLVWALPLILLGSSCRSSQARTLYVAPNGSDNAAGTQESPLSNPATAIRAAAPGDTVLLRGGRYELKKSLRLTQENVTLAGAPGETAILNAPIDEAANVQSVVFIAASGVTLSNLQIHGGSYYGVKIDVPENEKSTHGVTVRDCRIGGTGRDCIKTFNADALLIDGCEIGPSGVRDPSNAEGIDSIGSHGVTIHRNWVHDTATNGIYLKGGATDGIIDANRIENVPHAAGILLGQDTDLEYMRDGVKYEAIRCTARNNLVINTGGAGVGTYSGDTISFQNNTLYNVAQESSAGIWVGIDRRDVPARNVSLKNNIVLTSGVRPQIYLLKMEGALDSDYNLFSTTGGEVHFRTEVPGQVKTFQLSNWRNVTGGDAHSKTGAPMLDTARLYKPLPGSPVIDAGTDLPSVHTDFESKPRQHGKNFDIGATAFTD